MLKVRWLVQKQSISIPKKLSKKYVVKKYKSTNEFSQTLKSDKNYLIVADEKVFFSEDFKSLDTKTKKNLHVVIFPRPKRKIKCIVKNALVSHTSLHLVCIIDLMIKNLKKNTTNSDSDSSSSNSSDNEDSLSEIFSPSSSDDMI
ncbi:hypothetical protein M0813_21296 [Anaeramoeba flamelloides]|uniref:Uncharacterized protein n=1 Tax=Anaeramoeba flamelloides TaxID=1746091 RepID=A0ABQ8YHF7_9EUKA|nr:hypothetical protein M0813_21296 [Anaeramoeba flamelloides]